MALHALLRRTGRWLRKVRSRMNPRLSQPTSLPIPHVCDRSPNVVPLRRGVLFAVAWSGWFGVTSRHSSSLRPRLWLLGW
jgi:hypothetical protein